MFTHDPDAHFQTMYLDGVPVGLNATGLDPSQGEYTNFWLDRSNFQKDPFFNGSINELRIYDHALRTAEVTASFAAGPDAPLPEPSILGAGLVTASVVASRRGRRRNDAASA